MGLTEGNEIPVLMLELHLGVRGWQRAACA